MAVTVTNNHVLSDHSTAHDTTVEEHDSDVDFFDAASQASSVASENQTALPDLADALHYSSAPANLPTPPANDPTFAVIAEPHQDLQSGLDLDSSQPAVQVAHSAEQGSPATEDPIPSAAAAEDANNTATLISAAAAPAPAAADNILQLSPPLSSPAAASALGAAAVSPTAVVTDRGSNAEAAAAASDSLAPSLTSDAAEPQATAASSAAVALAATPDAASTDAMTNLSAAQPQLASPNTFSALFDADTVPTGGAPSATGVTPAIAASSPAVPNLDAIQHHFAVAMPLNVSPAHRLLASLCAEAWVSFSNNADLASSSSETTAPEVPQAPLNSEAAVAVSTARASVHLYVISARRSGADCASGHLCWHQRAHQQNSCRASTNICCYRSFCYSYGHSYFTSF